MIPIINLDRIQLLNVLPKNATVAEIGVYRGEYSEHIVKNSHPDKLILIDPWKTMLDADHVDPKFEYFYNEVVIKFKDNKNIEIIRKTSTDALQDINNETLDWVYIDGNHNYEPCLDDLRTYAPKVKEDGYICGHDWVTRHKPGFGVNQAVEEFVKETGFVLIGLTNEINFKSYVIAKNSESSSLLNL